MLSGKLKAKLVFFASHLAVSIAILCAWIVFAKSSFFPDPWFTADGAWEMLKVVILIDVVAGPILAAFVFDKSKKEWKRDIGIILMVQLLFFGYGAKTLWDARPAHVVWVSNNMQVVSSEQAEKSANDLRFSMRPQYHAVSYKSAKELSEATKKAEQLDIPFFALSENWISLDAVKTQSGWDLEKIEVKTQAEKVVVEEFKKQNPNWKGYVYMGLYGKEKTALWAWSKVNKQPIGFIWVDLPK